MGKKSNILVSLLVQLISLSILTCGCRKVDDSPTYGSMTDQDGNIYKTVAIGKQVWMAENLKTTRYSDGTLIPLVEAATEWQAIGPTGKAYCWYDNNIENKDTYGALYTWAAAMNGALSSFYEPSDVQGVCPTGWHIPSVAEWRTLTNYLEGESVAGSLLKESGISHWVYPNEEATNSTGFAALPGGVRNIQGGFGGLGYIGIWWTSLETSSTIAYEVSMAYGHEMEIEGQKKILPASDVIIFNPALHVNPVNNKNSGYSVRCVEGAATSGLPVITKTVTSVIISSAVSGGDINSEVINSVTARGVCWSPSPNPTIDNNKTVDGAGPGEFSSNISGLNSNTKYYVRAYVINSSGVYYGNEISFKTMTGQVADIDGNAYYTVTIGNQIWMGKNLMTTRYNDGTAISLVSDSTEWSSLVSPGYCLFRNNLNNKNIYGALYNWYTVNHGKLCPTGWHVPNDNEWTTLINYLGGKDVAGDKLKEVSNMHWRAPSQGTNETSFTALPGGFRDWDGSFIGIGGIGSFWSSSLGEIPTYKSNWMIVGNGHHIIPLSSGMKCAYSIRCLKD